MTCQTRTYFCLSVLLILEELKCRQLPFQIAWRWEGAGIALWSAPPAFFPVGLLFVWWHTKKGLWKHGWALRQADPGPLLSEIQAKNHAFAIQYVFSNQPFVSDTFRGNLTSHLALNGGIVSHKSHWAQPSVRLTRDLLKTRDSRGGYFRCEKFAFPEILSNFHKKKLQA